MDVIDVFADVHGGGAEDNNPVEVAEGAVCIDEGVPGDIPVLADVSDDGLQVLFLH